MTTPRTATAALVTAIQSIDGTGSYTYDLSGADRVVVASQVEWTQLPQVLVWVESVREEAGYELTRTKVVMTVHLIGIVGAANDTGADRLYAAFDLLQDMKLALRADRRFGEAIIIQDHEGAVMIADDEGGDLYGIADLTVALTWQEVAV
jgi:hypothetical protein